jgi:hypothetical protein
LARDCASAQLVGLKTLSNRACNSGEMSGKWMTKREPLE